MRRVRSFGAEAGGPLDFALGEKPETKRAATVENARDERLGFRIGADKRNRPVRNAGLALQGWPNMRSSGSAIVRLALFVRFRHGRPLNSVRAIW